MEIIYTVENLEDSLELGKQIAKLLKPGMVVRLEGDLGAGKTTFTKGIGKGLDIERIIKSPTYTLIREYTEGRIPLYHMDLYRLDLESVMELGLEEYFEGNGVSVIEWGSNAEEELPEEFLLIKIEKVDTESEKRSFQLSDQGNRYKQLLEDLENVRRN